MASRSVTRHSPGPGKGTAAQLPVPSPTSMTFWSPEGDEITVSYEFVDPKAARELLEANKHNRPESPRTSAQYGRSIEAKKWPFTGDPMQIDYENLVLNGQHRAEGIELAQTGLWMLMVRGLPPSTQLYMDIGRRRTPIDQLALKRVSTPSHLTATAHLMVSWEHWRDHRSVMSPGVNEVVEYALEHEDRLREAWTIANQIFQQVKRGVSKASIAAAYCRAREVAPPFVVAHFFDRLAYNSGLRRGEPAHTLMNWLIKQDWPHKVRDLLAVVRAWNAEQLGEPLPSLKPPQGGISAPAMPDMSPPVDEDVSPEREEAMRRMEALKARQAAGGKA